MHKALYRKWRPLDFDTVVGQRHITDVLKYQVASGRISHAYLFCGSRGTGKTSCAKILAKAVNCENPVNGNPCQKCAACLSISEGRATDVTEMDAASNNGVENVRDIREEVLFAPASLRYRVYIIDEVHMLSASAFNALLKTLEEPPAHVIFILATTEMQKLPATIISRCQRYDFRRIATAELSGRLGEIAKAEGISLEEDAALVISRLAQGGMRDAISLFELCAGSGEAVTVSTVSDMLGAGKREDTYAVIRAIAGQDYETLYATVAEVVTKSKDLTVFFSELIEAYRDMLVVKTAKDAAAYLDLTDAEEAALRELAALFTLEALTYQSKLLEEALLTMQKGSAAKRSCAELALTRLCDPRLSLDSAALLARVGKLEEEIARLKLGVPAAPPSEAPRPQKPVPPSPKVEEKPKAAPKAEEQAPPPPAEKPKPQENKGEALRPLPCWREVVETLSLQKRSLAGFLSKVKMLYSEKDGFVMQVVDDFVKNILTQESTLMSIKAAISEKMGRSILHDPFTVTVLPHGAGARLAEEWQSVEDED
ncbi:MAG: DNA polymerase III subunit gamma/tau [Clostridia bacterium]|nr:DNA polymerase III subunit gamma/tau [Clostridia bacterium]